MRNKLYSSQLTLNNFKHLPLLCQSVALKIGIKLAKVAGKKIGEKKTRNMPPQIADFIIYLAKTAGQESSKKKTNNQ